MNKNKNYEYDFLDNIEDDKEYFEYYSEKIKPDFKKLTLEEKTLRDFKLMLFKTTSIKDNNSLLKIDKKYFDDELWSSEIEYLKDFYDIDTLTITKDNKTLKEYIESLKEDYESKGIDFFSSVAFFIEIVLTEN